jgi:hypothetical protein
MDTVAAEEMPRARAHDLNDIPLSLFNEGLGRRGARPAGIYNLRFFAGTFVALSVLDFYLTWLMVGKWQIATEANPVAAGVLRHAGWAGLLSFKCAATGFVVVVIQMVARRNLRSARLLFRTGVVALALVVGYSGIQVLANLDLVENFSHHAERDRQLRERARVQQRFSRAADVTAEKILNGQCSLSCAVDELSLLSGQTTPRGADYLRTADYRSLNEETAIAATLITRVGFGIQHDPVQADRLFHSLAADFKRYHHTLPWICESAFFPDRAPPRPYGRCAGEEDGPPPSPGCWFINFSRE